MAQVRVGFIAAPGDDEAMLAAVSGTPGLVQAWQEAPDRAEAAIARGDVDAVIVSAAPAVGLQLVRAALAAGLHVMTTGPVGTSVEDIIELRRLEAHHRGCVLKLGFAMRHHQSVTTAADLLASGQLGEVVFLRAIFGVAGRQRLGDAPVLLVPGLYMLDLIHLFAGPSQDIKAMSTAPHAAGTDAEHNLQALLRTYHGTTSSLHLSASQWRETFRVEIGCARGYIWLDGLRAPGLDLGPEMLITARLHADQDAPARPNPEEDITEFTADVAAPAAVGEFVTAIQGGARIRNGTSDQAFDAINAYQRLIAATASFD